MSQPIIRISIHALREEGDRLRPRSCVVFSHISIHALREEGDAHRRRAALDCLHFYPRPPRGGRPIWVLSRLVSREISIHALREEGDGSRASGGKMGKNFYPRPPRGGRLLTANGNISMQYFYPRPPRGGRQSSEPELTMGQRFLSTPSARRATVVALQILCGRRISIHALREEGDPWTPRALLLPADFYPRPPRGGRPPIRQSASLATNFYPRPPRGGRHRAQIAKMAGKKFLSTPSARRATHQTGGRLCSKSISIHALREEGDPHQAGRPYFRTDFYPRPPRGGRLPRRHGGRDRQQISIHALREEGDPDRPRKPSRLKDFYPRPPRGGRHGQFAHCG